MNKLNWALFFTCLLGYLNAQNIHVKGKIADWSGVEMIYVSDGEVLVPLSILEDGSFALALIHQELPAFISFNKLSPRGKIEQVTPLIWFEKDSVAVEINLTQNGVQIQNPAFYQEFSEKIEALKGKDRIKFVLNNPNSVPSLYFAEEDKSLIALNDLEKFLQEVNAELRESIYYKRLEAFLKAKKQKPVKKGKKLEDFSLPDKNGNDYAVLSTSKKPKLIALFSSGCSFSVASISFLEELYQANQQIEIITIWEDQSKETWLNAQKDQKAKITWTDLWDEFGYAATYLDREMWPTFYLVNTEGVLLNTFRGYNKKTIKNIKRALESLNN